MRYPKGNWWCNTRTQQKKAFLLSGSRTKVCLDEKGNQNPTLLRRQNREHTRKQLGMPLRSLYHGRGHVEEVGGTTNLKPPARRRKQRELDPATWGSAFQPKDVAANGRRFNSVG